MLLFCSSSAGQNGGGHPHISQGTAAHPGNWVWAATNEITFDAFIIKRHNGTLYATVAFCDSQQVLLTVTFPEAVIYLMGIFNGHRSPHNRRGGLELQLPSEGKSFELILTSPHPQPLPRDGWHHHTSHRSEIRACHHGRHSQDRQGSLWNTALLMPHPLHLLISFLSTSEYLVYRETLENTGECEGGRQIPIS